MSFVIQAENLAKTYGGFRALKGISFGITKGECFGFLGHNGAGKSTTMKMIYGLSTVDEGFLEIVGERIQPITPPHIKQIFGIVPQEDNLDSDLSVIENLEVYGGYFGITSKKSREYGQELLEFMGLADKADVNVELLSGGAKRRLVIARALINNPQIIILDEPTTGLDPQARRLVWQKLRRLKEEGVTMILTTHYMEEAAQLCDRLVIMNDGLILAEGSPEELTRQYVLPFVIEVRIPIALLPSQINEKIEEMGGRAEYIVDSLFIFTNDGKSLWNKLGDLGLSERVCYLRPTNLEDVFLKLTGKRDEE
ncbi:ATP-binding cassette domain-containing protein [Pelosinus sp. IPA-1]|uniref:ABC transporter ATP-binding protein n=1 Tax=Pelosinus sp. IPA-1 TaxID=3029569 RepID=UPI0024362B7B|nr:ATP-binding cassette domain-containing protein [Pelosinus sp. IPA-1]GMB01987.1 ABC transporter [Pelosinus sp. IPA-1]